MSNNSEESIEIKILQDDEYDKVPKQEQRGTDSSLISNNAPVKVGTPSFGLLGFKFKGPENFGNSPEGELMKSQIFHFIEPASRGSHGGRNISKADKISATGGIPGLKKICRFPLKFNHPSLEKLFSLNLNEWILRRMPLISVILSLITLVFWPLTVLAFKNAGGLEYQPYVFLLFNASMGATLILSLIPLISFYPKLSDFSEKICYYSFGTMNFVWGCWLVLGCFSFRDNYQDVSALELITTRDALKALNFLYCLLPIASLDSFLPMRTSKTWWIHIQFILFYSIGILTTGYVNSYVPWTFVVFRIIGYTSIMSLLFFGSYSSELQVRISFYTWLTTSSTISRLERDISGFKRPDKLSTPAENILAIVKNCQKIAHITHEALEERVPEFSDSLGYLCKELKKCETQITKTPNLYYIPYTQMYKELGGERELITSYFTRYQPLGLNKPESVEGGSIKGYTREVRSLGYDTRFSQYLGTVTKVESKVNMFQLLNDWNFSVLDHFKTDPQPFISIGKCLLSEFQTHFEIQDKVLMNFLSVVEGLYNKVPYHNRIHGIFVAQKICCLANYIGIYDNMSVLDRAVMVVSSLCHDIGHPAKTNSFFVNSGHDVAQLFNDKSVLENFHTCLTFNVLRMPECNIFSVLEFDEMRQVRRRIIELILATDLEDHFESISSFRVRRVSPDFCLQSDLGIITKMLIKASDIASCSVTWHLSYEWAQRIFSEFYSQGELERSLELPVSAICDSNRHREIPKAQSGFLRYVAAPLFEEISKVAGYVKSGNFTKNISTICEVSETTNSSSSFNLSECESRKDQGRLEARERRRKVGKRSNIRLLEGLIPEKSRICEGRSSEGYEVGSEGPDSLSYRRSLSANRVHAVCLHHIKENAEKWEQMAEIGETLPVVKFESDEVNLDIHLVIQN